MDDLISPTLAAQILKVSRQTITRWCRDKKLDARQVGVRRWVISRASVEAMAMEMAKGKR